MAKRVGPDDYPWWVTLSLLGVSSRAAQWVCVAVSVALAAGSVAYGFWNPLFFWGIGFLFAALMYWLTIRWVDRHGSWDRH